MILPLLKLIGIILLPFFMYFSLKSLKEIKDLLSQILIQVNSNDKDKATIPTKKEE